ncbi:MAG: hypothetical protein AAF806_12595 [Bacteroidota bacterium]
MNKPIIILAISLLASSCVHSQEEAINLEKLQAPELKHLFSEGVLTVDVLDYVRPHPNYLLLASKFQEAIQENYEWFQAYSETSGVGKKLKYHPNLGLSEAEYEEFQAYLDQIKYVSAGQAFLTILQSDSTLTFEADGKLAPLRNLSIDLSNNQIFYEEYPLLHSEVITREDTDNVLKSPWKGHQWEFLSSKNFTEELPTTMEELKKISLTQIKLTIGQLQHDGKTFVHLEVKKIEKGRRVAAVELPLLW